MASVFQTGGGTSADVAVPELIRKLQGAPRLLRAAAPDIAAALEAEARRTIDQQRTPYGEAWPLTKDGKPALIHASRWLTSRASGTAIRLVIRGYMGLHDLGRARGRVQRRMLPTVARGLPPSWAAAIDRVITYHLAGELK